MKTNLLEVIQGDSLEVLRRLPSNSIHCCVTSPPYWGLRDYGVEGQIGLENTPEEFVKKLVEVFREVHRVLRKEGTLWLNLGDSYATTYKGGNKANFGDKSFTNKGGLNIPLLELQHGLKPKDLVGVPWRVAFALQAEGWFLRQDIIWHKPNPMPESVKDRPTKAHEYIFLLSKSKNYYYNAEAIKEKCIWDLDGLQTDARKERAFSDHKAMPTKLKNGIRPKSKFPSGWAINGEHSAIAHNQGQRRFDKQRGHSRRHAGFNNRWDQMSKLEQCSGIRNKRSVWTVTTQPYKEAHFATYPPDLIKPCVLAGCPAGGLILDPFAGSGTTGEVALELGRRAILIELNPKYISMIHKRCDVTPGFMNLELS